MPLDARLIGQQQSGPLSWMLRPERQPKSLADYGVQDIPFAPGLSSMVSELFKMAKAGAEHPGDVLTGRAEPSPERAMDLAMTVPLATGFVGPAMLASGAKQAAAPAFFSALSKAVDQSPLTKAPGEQWLGTLRNTPGVKPDELEWTGFADWAATQPNLTKQQAQEYLRANQVDVQEVVKVQAPGRYYNTPEQWEAAIAQAERQGNWDEAQRLTQAQEGLDPSTGSTAGQPKFSQYQLPGGENYRELLLTLPKKEGATLGPRGWGDTAGGTADNLNFASGHYDEPNVLAHVRFNDRIDSQGKKTLFLEEIQSDWHQKGRKQGYQGSETAQQKALMQERDSLAGEVADFGHPTPYDNPEVARRMDRITEINEQLGTRTGLSSVPDAPFKKDWHELSLKRMIKWAADNGYDQVAWTPGKVQAARYDLSKQVESMKLHLDTPAAERGGGLLEIRPKGDDSPNGIRVQFDGEGKINSAFRGSQFEGKTLDEVVGKEMAEKILQDAKSPNKGAWGVRNQSSGNWSPRFASKAEADAYQANLPESIRAQTTVMEMTPKASKTYSGLDLQVGGEGMNAFYDKMMVNSANKLGKKFGAKVEKSAVAARQGDLSVVETPQGSWAVQKGDSYIAYFPTKAEAENAASYGQEVWSLPITDAMRTKAQTEGFPLFANSPMASAPGLTAASLGSQQKLTPEQAKAYLRGNLL